MKTAKRSMAMGAILPTLFACTQSTPTRDPATEKAADERTAEEGAASAPAAETPSAPLHAHMQEHFVRVDQLQKAIVAGDLDAAQKHADWVATHPPHDDLPAGWKPHVAMMRARARDVLEASELDRAALATARVAGTCGSCHAANDADVKLGAEPEPRPGDGVEDRMKLHQWAADRMWDAVVSRSDDLWDMGVGAMSGAPVAPAALDGEPSEGSQLAAVLDEYRALSEVAKKAATPEARVEALGAYLSTCIGCHQVSEQGPEAW